MSVRFRPPTFFKIHCMLCVRVSVFQIMSELVIKIHTWCRVSKLTALEVRNSKDPGRLVDGGGVLRNNQIRCKAWLYRFRLDGKQQMYVIGRYPDLSLRC